VKDDSFDHITRSFPVFLCPGFMVMTLSFTLLSVTFSNQRFGSCCLTVDVGFVKLTLDYFCGNGLQDEYSVFLSPVLQ
jgi:hypothetical protein